MTARKTKLLLFIFAYVYCLLNTASSATDGDSELELIPSTTERDSELNLAPSTTDGDSELKLATSPADEGSELTLAPSSTDEGSEFTLAPSPADEGSDLKLQFPYNFDIDSDSSKSTLRDNAYAYVYQYPKHANESREEYRKHRNYTAVLTRFDASGVTSNKSCDIEFKSDQLQIFFELMVYTLHDDKITFAYSSGKFKNADYVPAQEMYHSYRVLHMDTCEYYDYADITTKYSLDEMPINHIKLDVFHRNDNFDMFLPEAPCDGARCKYTFNDKGEHVSGPERFLPTYYRNNVLKIYPSTKSIDYFVFVSDWIPEEIDKIPRWVISAEFLGSQKLMFVKGDDVTELTRFDYKNYDENLLVKNSNGSLSVCRQYKSDNTTEINCMQFDENVVKLNTTISVRDDDELFAIYNLPTGGILMAIGSSEGLSIQKWSLENEVQEIYTTRDFESELSVKYVILNVESDGALCISVYYTNGYKLKQYDFLKKCYSKDILTVVRE